MSIDVTGAPAARLLRELKRRVQRDEELKELGVGEIYISKDGFLNCDATDKSNPVCYIWFNPSEVKIEPACICE